MDDDEWAQTMAHIDEVLAGGERGHDRHVRNEEARLAMPRWLLDIIGEHPKMIGGTRDARRQVRRRRYR